MCVLRDLVTRELLATRGIHMGLYKVNKRTFSHQEDTSQILDTVQLRQPIKVGNSYEV